MRLDAKRFMLTGWLLLAGGGGPALAAENQSSPLKAEHPLPVRRYPQSVLDQKQNEPGIKEVRIDLRGAPGLPILGPAGLDLWDPWSPLSTKPEHARSLLLLREWLARQDLGVCDWGVLVKLRIADRNGRDVVECDSPSSSSSADEWNRSVDLWGLASLTYQGRRRGEAFVDGQPQTRLYREKLPVAGQRVDCRCAEGTVRLTLVHETWVTLTLRAGATDMVLFRSGRPGVVKYPGTLIVRLCPEANWYYMKLKYGKWDVGPGWKEAPAAEAYGGHGGWLHFTGLHEEYSLEWTKRLQPLFDTSGKVVGLVTAP
jgi:hypothetical protein